MSDHVDDAAFEAAQLVFRKDANELPYPKRVATLDTSWALGASEDVCDFGERPAAPLDLSLPRLAQLSTIRA